MTATRLPLEISPEIMRFKYLTEHVLPALAREQHWPIRLDHCFKRICLDHAFDDVWHHHIARPAEQHLLGEPLARAVHCAAEIARLGLPSLHLHNRRSLAYRGKGARPNPSAAGVDT